MIKYSFPTAGLSLQTLERITHPIAMEDHGFSHSALESVAFYRDDTAPGVLEMRFKDVEGEVSYLLPDQEESDHFKAIYEFYSQAIATFIRPDGSEMIPMAAIETAADKFIPLIKCGTHKLVPYISNEALWSEGADIVGYRIMNHVMNHTGPNRNLVMLKEVLVPCSLSIGTTGREDYDYWFPFLLVANEICFCGTVGSSVLVNNLPVDNPEYANVWTGRVFWVPSAGAKIEYSGANAVGSFEFQGDVNKFALTDTGAVPIYAPYLGVGESSGVVGEAK